MRSYVLVFLLLLGCLSCEKNSKKLSRIKLTEIAKIDGENENEYNGTFIEFAHIVNNEFLFVENSTSEVFNYDFNTFKLKKKFGKKGQGPNEFVNIFDVIRDEEGKYYVNDSAKRKIIVLDENGIEEETIDYLGGTHFFNVKKDIYVGTYGIMPGAKLTQLTNGNKDIVIEEYLTKEVPDRNDRHTQYNSDGENIYISFAKFPQIIKITGDSYKTIEYQEPKLTYSMKMYNNCFPFKDGWLREVFSYDETKEDLFEQKIVYYSKDFQESIELDLKEYPNINRSRLIAVDGDFAVFNAFVDGIIYKYKVKLY